MNKTEDSGKFYIQNRKNVERDYRLQNDLDKTTETPNETIGNNIQLSSSSITGIEGFKGNISELAYDGPVAKQNMAGFTELQNLQNKFNRQLQEYNTAIQTLSENSRGYVSASNRNNNRFANKYLKDGTSGATGYVTDRGVWKHLPNPQMGNSIQGKNGCPANWTSAQSIKADDGQSTSISNASEGDIIKMGGISIIKGTPTIANQSCNTAGQNIYITNPSRTTNRRYIECSQNPGSFQSDIGSTTIEACAKRAEDMGSNVFQLGQNNGGGRGNCFIGGGGNPINSAICQVVPGVGQMGQGRSGRWVRNGRYWWGGWKWRWESGYNGYATYQTSGANRNDLGKTFYITDDLTKKEYPNNRVTRTGDDFQLLPGYNSSGNDIVSGSGLSVEQIKQKCIEIPGAAGFYVSGNNYWIKNANMWPNGNRQFTGGDLYVRNTKVTNNNSCSKVVNFSQQSEVAGYINDGFMNMNTTCGLGTINANDTIFINEQYDILNGILDEIHQKIVELSKEDVGLNKKLLDEYNLLKQKLHTYENTYKEIRGRKKTIGHYNALEDDSNLQMLSYNQKYILWSMLALGVTAGAMKIMK